MRVNPGFGHGHVQSCDTGGPSSKHGVWHEALGELRARAIAAKVPITELHAHLGTGPRIAEFDENLRRFVGMMAPRLTEFPDIEAINLGGGIPHPYRPGAPSYDLGAFRRTLVEVARRARQGGRTSIRVEIEPGRYPVAAAGFVGLSREGPQANRVEPQGPRPSVHHGRRRLRADRTPEPFVVAGPLCESGDVFTRDDKELLDPRPLPQRRSAISWCCTTPAPTAPR